MMPGIIILMILSSLSLGLMTHLLDDFLQSVKRRGAKAPTRVPIIALFLIVYTGFLHALVVVWGISRILDWLE